MEVDQETPKKKVNKSDSPTEGKKSDRKSDGEDPKPRIVLTFRSEKPGAKSSSMKIVHNEEKHEEVSPRRSSRTRSQKWDSDDDVELSSPPKKDRSHQSENDDASDNSQTVKRSTRCRSKEFDNVIANAIARKEKSYNETPAPSRPSRRIKPTAKVLANEEMRIGLESQNNARQGGPEKMQEKEVKLRRSARALTPATYVEPPYVQRYKQGGRSKDVDVPADKEDDPNQVMKLKHLCELGLKAINTDGEEFVDEDGEAESEESEAIEIDDEMAEDDEEIDEDDDTEVINKLLEADSDTNDNDSDFVPKDRSPPRSPPRRSIRLQSYYEINDRDTTPSPDEEQGALRRSSRANFGWYKKSQKSRPRHKVKKTRSTTVREENNTSEDDDGEEIDEPAAGEEGAEAACPTDDKNVMGSCSCEAPSNIHAAPQELAEPVFCQAIELVDGIRVGCSHGARKDDDGSYSALLRAGPRTPFILVCSIHAAQMRKHMCCSACGLFCTQGIFYQCTSGHLFHVDCGIPLYEEYVAKPSVLSTTGCPHCGVVCGSYHQPANTDCKRVQLLMRTSNRRVLLPDQRVQCTQAYLSFSSLDPSKIDQGPMIPEDLLPPLPDLKTICEKPDVEDDPVEAAHGLYDGILAGETVEQLVPKILSGADVNTTLGGDTCLHAAVRRGYTAAAHILVSAGADLNATHQGRTPLMQAVQALLDKSGNKTPKKSQKAKETEDMEVDESKEDVVKDGVVKDVEFKNEEDLLEITDTVVVKKEPQETDTMEVKESSQSETEVKEELLAQDDKPKVKSLEKDETMQVDPVEKDKNTAEPLEKSEMDRPSDEDLLKVIKYLIAAGCDVNLPGPDGMTALHMAAQHGGSTVCGILLSNGAAVDPRDQGGWTPLVWAAENSHHETVRVLLDAGADATATDAEGNAVVHWCALAGAGQCLQALLHAAPNAVHAANAHADTPLHVAARQGHYPCVVILLARGAKTDVENSAGEQPAEVCEGQCRATVLLHAQMQAALGDRLTTRRLLTGDISRGRELHPIPCVNDVDNEPLPDSFTYVTRHVMPEQIHVDTTLESLQGCSCPDEDCSQAACACGVLGVKRWWVRGGKLAANFPYHDPPMLFECNHTCGCHAKKCTNSVITRLTAHGSVFIRAAVFRCADGRGWGLRAAMAVPRGAPVAAYVGELLTVANTDTRAADQYMFALDVKPDLLEQCTDKTVLCVDAAQYGGAARFINHGCRPNLAPVRVFTATRDLRLPVVALFAARDIAAGEELTFDYGEKFWSVKSKWMRCECGSVDCRYPAKTNETDAS